MGYKSWYLYVNYCYKTFLKIVLNVTKNINVLDTFIFKKYLILPCNSKKLPSFLQDRLIGRSPRA